MDAPEKEPTEPQTSSAEARRLAIDAWACIGVAAIAAAYAMRPSRRAWATA